MNTLEISVFVAELVVGAQVCQNKNPQLRYGQALMNVLQNKNKELYNFITGTDDDPFYDNHKIAPFFNRVRVYLAAS